MNTASLLPPGSTGITINKNGLPGEITGYYDVVITRADGSVETIVATGQEMVLLLGAFVVEQLEKKTFAPLLEEVATRNNILEAMNEIMPVLVKLQNTVPSSGTISLSGNDLTIWQKNAPLLEKAGYIDSASNIAFDRGRLTSTMNKLQTGLSDETKAGEQTMMKINTTAALRATFFGLMQSNASTFKSAMDTAAR
ncbi:MAG: hypothetical protein ACRCV3_00660 [Desulfovibrionaceae bacterium]